MDSAAYKHVNSTQPGSIDENSDNSDEIDAEISNLESEQDDPDTDED